MWIEWIAIISCLIIVSFGIAVIYASDRWRSETDKLRVKMTNGQQPIQPKNYDPKEIVDLPEPVQRFLMLCFRMDKRSSQRLNSIRQDSFT